MPDTAYRTRLPRTYTVEVQVKRWAIKKPFTRKQVWIDFGLACLWLVCCLLDVLQLLTTYATKHWWMLGIHLFCVAAWSFNVWFKLERRPTTETRTITE